MNDTVVIPVHERASRVFRWLLAFSFAIGPLACIANWCAAYTFSDRSCEIAAPPLLAPLETETFTAGFILLTLAVAGALCALSAWRSLKLHAETSPAAAADPAPTRFFTLWAIAGALLFVIVMVFNAVGLALLPACA